MEEILWTGLILLGSIDSAFYIYSRGRLEIKPHQLKYYIPFIGGFLAFRDGLHNPHTKVGEKR